LDCFDSTYRNIASDDPSAFSNQVQVAATDATRYITWKANNVTSFGEQDNRTMQPMQCKWLSTLGIVKAAACISGRHHHSSYTSPGGMVAHRIIHKRRGYYNHAEVPFLKPLPLSEILLLIWKLSLQAQQIGNPPATATDNLWYNNLVTFSDWKIVNYVALTRHFSRNAGISVNMSHKGTPLYFAASGNNPIHGCGGIMLPQSVEQNLSALYEYQVGNIWFYPMLWYDADVPEASVFVSGVTWFKASSTGWFKTAWSWITNTISGAEISGCYNSISSALNKYNKSVNILQAWFPFSPMMYTPQFNAGQCTCFYGDDEDQLISVSAPRRIPEDIRKHLDLMILPAFYVQWSGLTSDADGSQRLTSLQYIFGERYSISGDYGELQQLASVFNLTAQAIHVIGGGGSDLARVDEEEYEYDMKDTKSPRARSSGGSLKNEVQDFAYRTARNHAVKLVTGALLGV